MKIESFQDKKRISNIVWTITGQYGKEVDFSLLENEYFSYCLLYNAIILGALYNILDYRMIVKFIHQMQERVNKSKEIIYLLLICIEETCVNQNIAEIENIAHIRENTYKENIRKLETGNRADKVYNMFRNAYWHKSIGRHMVFPPSIRMLIKQVGVFKTIKDSREFIEAFKELISLYFHFEEEGIDEPYKAEDKEVNKGIQKKKEEIYTFFGSYTSSEFNPNESIIEKNFSTDASTLEDKEDLLGEEENLRKMEKYYGKSMYDKLTLHALEKQFCRGIHASYKLFFTRGEIETLSDSYRKTQLELEKKKNKEEYEKNKEKYERLIENLKNILKQILQEEDKIVFKSYSGNLDTKNMYKLNYTENYKMFIKEKRQEEKQFLVDIVIDSSASLLEKQAKIASQAYIISKALEDLKIKNSVKTYNSFLDYSIIKVLKKYEEKSSEKCFEYYCSGGNRDGLAIDVIGSMSKDKMGYEKLMIIFTDAKPFDVQVLHSVGRKVKKPYQGDIAIDDTANVIRKLRRQEIKLCGIFSGDKKDMNVIRYIYGQDFIYIDEIEQFSQKVGKYIKDYMQGLRL